MQLEEILTVERVVTPLDVSSKQDALAGMAQLFVSAPGAPRPDEVLQVLSERERLASTGVGSGVAIPHGRVPRLEKLIAAVGVSPGGIPFDAIDGQPVHILVAVLAPQRHTGDHLKVLAQVSRLLRSDQMRQRLVEAPDAAQVLSLLFEADRRGA